MSLFKKDKYPKHLNDLQDISLGKQILIFVWEVFKIVVISLAIIIPVRYYLIKPFYVKGASMEPTFHDHEYLIIDEISYRFNQPERGDIVVFKYPKAPSQFFIKRIVGLPNEMVTVSEGKVTIYNEQHPEGIVLQEDYLPDGLETMGLADVKLTEREYFILGDNRSASLDSRSFGPLDRDAIVGRVVWRGWPINKMEFIFDHANYDF